jgi:hypothetical protein
MPVVVGSLDLRAVALRSTSGFCGAENPTACSTTRMLSA